MLDKACPDMILKTWDLKVLVSDRQKGKENKYNLRQTILDHFRPHWTLIGPKKPNQTGSVSNKPFQTQLHLIRFLRNRIRPRF